MTFAAIDWVMSLEARWFSTIFAVVLGMGQVLSALAFAVAMLAILAGRPPLRGLISKRGLPRPGQPALNAGHVLGLHGLRPVPADLGRQHARGNRLVLAAVLPAAGCGWRCF